MKKFLIKAESTVEKVLILTVLSAWKFFQKVLKRKEQKLPTYNFNNSQKLLFVIQSDQKSTGEYNSFKDDCKLHVPSMTIALTKTSLFQKQSNSFKNYFDNRVNSNKNL